MRTFRGIVLALGLPVLLTVALVPLRGQVNLVSDVLLFLLGTVVVGYVGGTFPTVVAALVSSALLNYFFTPPVGTLTISEPRNVLALVVFVAVAAAAVWIVVSFVRGFHGRLRWRAAGVAAVRILGLGACLYLWFLGAWGLNYRRLPLIDRVELANDPPTSAVVLALGRQAVERLNEVHDAAHAEPWVDPWHDARLQGAFGVTQRLLGGSRNAIEMMRAPSPMRLPVRR